jgi:hypothetical protein
MSEDAKSTSIQASMMSVMTDTSAVPKWVKQVCIGMVLLTFSFSAALQALGLTGIFSSVVSGYAASLDKSTTLLREEIGKLSMVVFRIEKLEDRAARGEAATAAVVSDVDRLKKRVDLLEGVKIKTVTDRFRVVKVAPATAPIPASSVEPTWKMW